MLQIEKPNNIIFEGSNLMQKIPASQVGDFLLACVSEPVALGEELTLGEFMEISSHLKDFIGKYFIEEFQALNAIVSSDYMAKPISDIIVYKEMIISPSGEVGIFPKIKSENNRPTSSYHDVKLSYDPKMKVIDERGVMGGNSELNSSLSFLELLGAVFEDFQDYITVSLS